MSLLTPELSLAWSFDPTPSFQAFFNVALSRNFLGAAGTGESDNFVLEVKEAYVRAGQLASGPSVYVGRQRFEDERKWLYDEDLDAVRFRYERGTFAVELSASRSGVVRKDLLSDHDRERINNYVVQARWRPRDWLELEGYAIARDDRSSDRQRPVFVGARSRGEPLKDLDYWLELAYVGGRDGSKEISGWAVEVGATYEWQVGPKPSVTLGGAFGSGDRNPDDRHDGSFRQTGLQRNEGDFGGSTDFKYYGEVLDPELSNLAIFTVGLGVRPSETASVDLVYHYYLQQRASTTLRNAALDAEPSGRRRRLGAEIDLVLGLVDVLNHIDVKAVLGYFIPGAAFPGGTGAWLVGSKVQYRF